MIIWSLELSGDCLELDSNDKNGGKDLVALRQPWRRCNYIYKSGDLII